MREKEQYKTAIRLWGKPFQILMLSEECGELLSAVSKWQRGRMAEICVIEEMADVTIMMRQILVMMGREPNSTVLQDKIKEKLMRMKKLIDKELEKG